MLGINVDFNPRFIRKYASLHEIIDAAVKNYIGDVQSGNFPNEKEQY